MVETKYIKKEKKRKIRIYETKGQQNSEKEIHKGSAIRNFGSLHEHTEHKRSSTNKEYCGISTVLHEQHNRNKLAEC